MFKLIYIFEPVQIENFHDIITKKDEWFDQSKLTGCSLTIWPLRITTDGQVIIYRFIFIEQYSVYRIYTIYLLTI